MCRRMAAANAGLHLPSRKTASASSGGHTLSIRVLDFVREFYLWRHFHRPAGALRSGELSGVRELAERRPVEELVVGIVHELHGRHGPRALLCCRAMPGGNAPVVPRADGGMLELSKDNLSRR
jgi:hypothetical protein